MDPLIKLNAPTRSSIIRQNHKCESSAELDRLAETHLQEAFPNCFLLGKNYKRNDESFEILAQACVDGYRRIRNFGTNEIDNPNVDLTFLGNLPEVKIMRPLIQNMQELIEHLIVYWKCERPHLLKLIAQNQYKFCQIIHQKVPQEFKPIRNIPYNYIWIHTCCKIQNAGNKYDDEPPEVKRLRHEPIRFGEPLPLILTEEDDGIFAMPASTKPSTSTTQPKASSSNVSSENPPLSGNNENLPSYLSIENMDSNEMPPSYHTIKNGTCNSTVQKSPTTSTITTSASSNTINRGTRGVPGYVLLESRLPKRVLKKSPTTCTMTSSTSSNTRPLTNYITLECRLPKLDVKRSPTNLSSTKNQRPNSAIRNPSINRTIEQIPGKKKDYLKLSFITVAFFSTLFGVLALNESIKTREFNLKAKNHELNDPFVIKSSKRAFLYNKIGILYGIILYSLLIALFIYWLI